jgi:hypothetical protein
MICDHATKCSDKANGCCVISRPHVCKDCHPEDGGPTFCYIAERYVRCIPHRNYDAEGRAARLECINTVRRYSSDNDFMSGARKMCLAILKAMRNARKGAKNG